MQRLTKRKVTWFAIAMLGAQGAATAAPGTWQEPTAGWQSIYSAGSNLRPDELDGTGTNKTYSNSQPRFPAATGYQTTDPTLTNYAGITTDAASGESGKALLIRTSTTNSSVFQLTTPPGSGSVGDLITVDIRFRLLSATSNTFPFFLDVGRLPTAAQNTSSGGTADEQFTQLRFRPNASAGLSFSAVTAAGTLAANTAALGTIWHDVRLRWDTSGGGIQVFVDGSSTPVTFAGGLTTLQPAVNTTIPAGTNLLNVLQFGRTSSSTTANDAHIAYVKMTSSELVAVVAPEPATIGVVAAAAIGTLQRRRRRA